MDHDKLQDFVDDISKGNNGVNGIVIINRNKGKVIVQSREPRADGDLAEMLSWLAPIISLKKEFDEPHWGVATPLAERMQCFQNCVLNFEGGAVIINFIDDWKVGFPVLIAYFNLDIEKVKMAETTAEMTTYKIIPLLQ